ncbi:MAG: hypothetical protein QOJ79_2689 [Actinomycetota bacterium]|jgi:hypothetical protein|nr:hypothetical protein [Actinomycetota bacterium]
MLFLWMTGIAGYGYFMRFLRDTGQGSAATMGAPYAKRVAPYCLAAAAVFGAAALLALLV